MKRLIPWSRSKSDKVEEAKEASEKFAVPQPPVLSTEDIPQSTEATFQQSQAAFGQPPAGVVQHSIQERRLATSEMPHSSPERDLSTGAVPKTKAVVASPDSRTIPKSSAMEIPQISTLPESFAESKAFWEGTGALPKYLSKEYADKAPKYLPPFKKPNSPKPKIQPPTEPPGEFEVPSPSISESALPSSEVSSAATSETSAETSADPPRERRSSRSERAQFVRQHCLDFQDYKRTVNNKQKGLEQSLNQVLPKMNSAMVDAQKLAAKIEKVRSLVCDTEESLKTQNDKMKYLVGRTVGTIAKIDGLFDRFRTDILDYTTLTTEGNDGIDRRLSKLLKILCGLEDKDLEKEENTVIREAFSEEDDGSKE